MKRTLTSAFDLESSGGVDTSHKSTHPSDVVDDATPPNPYASWSILVDDMQGLVVSNLDRGTKQCLALTCKDAFVKYYDDMFTQSSADPDNIFLLIIPHVDIRYLERFISRFNREFKVYSNDYLSFIARYRHSDVFTVLTWFINLYYYNVAEDIIINKKMHSALEYSFVETANVDGLRWMATQPWFDKQRRFAAKHMLVYHRLVAHTGNIDLLNYLMENSDFFDSEFDLLDVRRTKLLLANLKADGTPFNWPMLFNSNENWRNWWATFKYTEQCTAFLVGCITCGRVAAFGDTAVGGIWHELSEGTRSRLKNRHAISLESLIATTAEETHKIIGRVMDMGFAIKDALFVEQTLENFLNVISNDANPFARDWLCERHNNLLQEPTKAFRTDLLKRIPEWVLTIDAPSVAQAVAWLKSHPFPLTSILIDLIQSSRLLVEDVFPMADG